MSVANVPKAHPPFAWRRMGHPARVHPGPISEAKTNATIPESRLGVVEGAGAGGIARLRYLDLQGVEIVAALVRRWIEGQFVIGGQVSETGNGSRSQGDETGDDEYGQG